MATISPTQFARKTRQCKQLCSSPIFPLFTDDSWASGQLGPGEAASDIVLPRMDSSCTFARKRHSRLAQEARICGYGCYEREMDADGSQIQAPEIQSMYSVPLPTSVIRTRLREQFEKHRFVDKLPVVDVLLFQSHAEYQVLQPSAELLTNVCTRTEELMRSTGNDELLEAAEPCHVILQGGEFQARQEVTGQLHVGFPGGRFPTLSITWCRIDHRLTSHSTMQGRN